jgi:hypothetical protein
LQACNSGSYDTCRPLDDVHEAVVLLGSETVRALVLFHSIFAQCGDFRLPGYSVKSLAQHSLAVARLSKALALADDRDNAFAESCYLAGIVHNVGQLILASNCQPDFSRAIDLANSQQIPLFRAENEIFGSTHADVGAYPEANGTGNIKKGGDDSLLIYQMCFGDGVGEDGVASAGEALDGAPDEGATVYINELDPNAGAKAGWFDKTPVPTKLLDPWGRAWYYRSGTADALNPDFDLWSTGMDPSLEKDSDDLTNW